MENADGMISEPATVLDKLRSATTAAHQRAESLVGLPQSLDAHIKSLTIFYGFIEPWETSFHTVLMPLHGQLLDRRKFSLLQNDLKKLGVTDSALKAIPHCDKLPRLNDVPTALASMYVFEGATLGGQILSRHIEKQLGLQDGAGYSFYRSYGSRVGIMWREFGVLLRDHISDASADAAINSARETFNCLCDWFDLQRRQG